MAPNKRPLRINILIHRPSTSGGARVLAHYARMLKEEGHEVTITGLGAKPKTLKQKLLSLAGAKSAPRTPSHYEREGLALNLLENRSDIRAGDIPDADLCIASFWLTAEWMNALPPGKGRKVYFVQHHEAAFPQTDRARAEATYRADSRIIVVSSWLADIMAKQYGRDDARLVLNAVDTKMFAPRGDRRKAARPTVGFLGSRNLTKRIDIAVGACEILREKFPDLRVIALAADKPNGAYVMHDWFDAIYDPPQEKLADIYGECDLWLFTSDIEGYGLPLLEALACGTPLVARPAGAAPDLVTPENGVLVDSDDPAAIANAAARILSLTPETWKAMSDAGLATAHAHDWSESFRQFEDALYDALEE